MRKRAWRATRKLAGVSLNRVFPATKHRPTLGTEPIVIFGVFSNAYPLFSLERSKVGQRMKRGGGGPVGRETVRS